MKWLTHQWPYAALFTAFFLIALSPFIGALGLPLLLIYLQLPIYMIHQFEEHDQDRFRTFANQFIGKGHEVFTPMAIFVINSLGVWVVDLIALYLAYYVDLAWGLMAIYLPVFNAVTHVVVAIVSRRYNPGLWTSIFVFFPVGIWAIMVVSEASRADLTMQALTLGVAIFVHAFIMIYARLKLKSFGL